MEPFILFCIGIAATALLSIYIRKLAERIFPSQILLLLLFPGIVIHEIFHAIASVAVGGKIHAITLFSLSGGSVLHEKPKVPFGQVFISFAPFIGGISLIILSSFLLFCDPICRSRTSADWVLGEIFDRVRSLWFWVWMYIFYSVSATMLPSWQDAKNAFGATAVFIVGIALLSYAGAFKYLFPQISYVVSLLLPILSLLPVFLLITLFFFFGRKLIR